MENKGVIYILTKCLRAAKRFPLQKSIKKRLNVAYRNEQSGLQEIR